MKSHRRVSNHYSESFKRTVIDEYLSSRCTKEHIYVKYDIRGKSSLTKWMQVLGYTDPYRKGFNLEPANQPALAKQSMPKPTSTLELEAKIKLLERQLEDERLRADMYNRLIDLAEKTYKISVRKNSNTK